MAEQDNLLRVVACSASDDGLSVTTGTLGGMVDVEALRTRIMAPGDVPMTTERRWFLKDN